MDGGSALKLARHIFLAPVYLYRYTLSAFMGRTCRHMPSCSEYMIEAVGKHGIWPGGWMGFARICRCRPAGHPVSISSARNCRARRAGIGRGVMACGAK